MVLYGGGQRHARGLPTMARLHLTFTSTSTGEPMNLLERELQYPLGDTLPEPGKTIELVPGVRWIRMGLPFALDHINLWLLRDRLDGREGWTIVDAGMADGGMRAAREQVFANELDGLPVLRVIVTHM